VAAATDRVSQRPESPEHRSDDQQDYPDGPKNRDFEYESENEKDDSESDHAYDSLIAMPLMKPIRVITACPFVPWPRPTTKYWMPVAMGCGRPGIRRFVGRYAKLAIVKKGVEIPVGVFGLAAGPTEFASGGLTPTGGATGTDQQHAQPQHCHSPDCDAEEKDRAGRPRDVTAKD
jgi:hypothetical protein